MCGKLTLEEETELNRQKVWMNVYAYWTSEGIDDFACNSNANEAVIAFDRKFNR